MSSPQTLKIWGYIKHHKVVVLIDSIITHNFFPMRLAQEIHFYVWLVNNFHILFTNGSRMKSGRRCENVKLEMGDYHLKCHMFATEMGCCGIVLEVEWLRTLGPISMNFKELYNSFSQDSQTHILNGLQEGSPKIITSHRM